MASKTIEFLRGQIPDRRINPLVRKAVSFLMGRGDLVGSPAHRALILNHLRHRALQTEIAALEAKLEAQRASFRAVALLFVAQTRLEDGEECTLCDGTGSYVKDGPMLEALKESDPVHYDRYLRERAEHERSILWCSRCQGTGWVPRA